MNARRQFLLALVYSAPAAILAACGQGAQGSIVATATPSRPAATTAAPANAGPTAPATAAVPAPQATLAPQRTATAPAPATATPAIAPQSTVTPAPTASPSPVQSPAATAAGALSDARVIASHLEIPWAVAFAPDGRIFITERPGRVRIVKDGGLLPTPWMTFSVFARPGAEGGLLGVALDPLFAQNHYVYVAYTYSNNGDLFNRLVRLRDDPATDTGAVDKVLLDGVLGGNNHDGGRIAFGPDGKLYWAVGETFQRQLAQDLSSLNGKILRLNADGSIPADNPFSGSAVYVYGVRNPEGLAWQPGSGRLYETENGPSGEKGFGQDEINLIEAGKNYGWPVISGAETHADMESPVAQSGNDTWAPSGATFVKGGPWDGSFFFAGLRGQSLYRLTFDANDPRKVLSFDTLLTGKYGRLRDVVQGPDGALYILTSNRDGRGSPAADDDRLIRLVIK